jgi:hypothetical protein
LLVVLENKKMPAEIKKGIIGKSPRMITASNIQRCGMTREWVGQTVKISLDAGSLRGELTDTRSVWGSFIRKNEWSIAERDNTPQ